MPTLPDAILRTRIIAALRAVELPSGIRTRIRFGELADAVLSLGAFDVVLADGVHLYNSTHCRHGDQAACDSNADGRRPAQCKSCGSPCRHTYPEDE